MEIITGKLNRTVPFTTSHQTANHHAVRQSFYGKLYVFPIESAFEYSLLSVDVKWASPIIFDLGKKKQKSRYFLGIFYRTF